MNLVARRMYARRAADASTEVRLGVAGVLR